MLIVCRQCPALSCQQAVIVIVTVAATAGWWWCEVIRVCGLLRGS